MRANRYVSYLAAEIEPKAVQTLNQWEAQATRTMERIAAAGSKGSGGLGRSAIFGPQIKSLKDLQAAADPTIRKIDAVDKATRRAAQGAGAMSTSLQRAGQALQIVQGPLGPLAGRLSALSGVMQTLTGYSLAGVLGGGGAFALGSIAAEYQNVTDKLRPLFDNQRNLNNALTDVIGIAQRTRQALSPVADLYASLTRTGGDAGLSQARIARLVETVSKSAQIGGGTQQGKEAALVQFGQALSGDFKTAGQEIQSILEQTPALANALFDGLGIKGVGAFKALAKEGALSSDLIIKALERQAEEVDLAFSRIPKRIGSALTQLNANFAIFVGRMDDSTGTTTAVAKGLSFVAENLGLVTTAVTLTAAAFSASTFARFAETLVVTGKNALLAAGNVMSLYRAVQSGNAVLIGSAQATQQRAQFIAQGARAEADAANKAVNSAKVYRQQVTANMSLLDKQIATQRKALETARTLDAAGRSTGIRSTDVVKKATDDLNRSLRARIATQNLLVASDLELAGAETRLTAATTGLIVAETELVIADTAAAASSTRLTAVKNVLAGAMARVGAAASGLVAFLGGPWGVAFTAAAVAVAWLASRHDYAREAIDRFKGSEEELLSRLENTTAAMGRQADQAVVLARALREAGLAQAEKNARDVRGQLAGDLTRLAVNIDERAGGRRMPGVGIPMETTADAQRLRALADKAKTAALSIQELNEVMAITRRNPKAAEGNWAQKLFGRDPSRVVDDLKGVVAAMYEVEDARKAIADFDARQKLKEGPLVGTGGKPATKAQLNAEARLLAAQNPLDKARAELALAMQKGPQDGESLDAYKQRIAGLIQSVEGLAEAEKAAAKARREGAAAAKRAAREMETASDKADRLANILDRYEEDTPIKRLEKLRDGAEKAKRAIDDLIGEKVEGYKGAFTAADAAKLKDKIDRSVENEERRPFDDMIKEGERRLQILDLEARGMGDLAELTRRRLELEQQMGDLYPEELDALRQQIADEHRLNDVLEQRNLIIENNARFLGEVRDAGRDAIRSFLDADIGGGLKNFAKRISNAYKDALANELSIKLFGDPEKKYRDEMTRGLNKSADKLTGSSDNLNTSADALERSAKALSDAATASANAPLVTADGTIAPSLLGQSVGGGLLGDLSGRIASLTSAIENQTAYQDGDDIVVTGRRPAKLGPITMPGGINSVLDKAFGGTMGAISAGLQGLSVVTGKGSIGSKIEGLFGVAAQAVAQANPMVGASLAIQSVLGDILGIDQRAGGFFGLLGSIGINALFPKKVKKGSATITDLSGNYDVSGNSKKRKKAAVGAADSVTSGLQRIVDALGGEVGDFAVSIGVREGQYRVDPTGRGKTKKSKGAVDFDEDYEAAIRFAIMDAIEDGAIQGIRESTQRLLKAGKDLDVALEKALKFEDVFKRLKRFKDPVGAAVDELNTEFKSLIKIFQEAGASAEEWAQLEELYGLERAEAIKNATENAVQLLDDFIKSITSGPDSPLSRRTIYENAKGEVDKFRADIIAGRPVDQEALIAALQNFQAASEELNGSRSQFYQDFADILGLAQSARLNVPTPTDGSLPPSPFDNLETTNTIIQEGVNQQVITNGLLAQLLAAMGINSSSLNSLPSSGGATTSGGGYGGGTAEFGSNSNVQLV